jgi:thiamine biosynthesis lipoprotein
MMTITDCCYPQQSRFEFTAAKMGSPFRIILYEYDSLMATHIAQQSFNLVDSLAYIFSDYIDSSELNRVCARAGKTSEPVPVSTAFYEIIQQAKIAYAKSEGTFDITLGPLTKLWRKARKENTFPTDSMVKEKLQLTGFNKIIIDTAIKSIRLIQAGMQLDLGGIAQGYIAQQVINYLKTKNITAALVDVSGDIVAIGAPPRTSGWTVGINVPGEKERLQTNNLVITNKAVTTSGDVYQYMEHGNKRYSHIIDPKTGYGITSQKNITVIASDGITADWLTKACSLLSFRKAKKLVQSFNAELLVATIENGKPVYRSTKHFKQYWKTVYE